MITVSAVTLYHSTLALYLCLNLLPFYISIKNPLQNYEAGFLIYNLIFKLTGHSKLNSLNCTVNADISEINSVS